MRDIIFRWLFLGEENLSGSPQLSRPAGNDSRIIWTLPAIGQRIGVSADFVRDTLLQIENTPVRQLGGRYYCFEDELMMFMRRHR